MQKLNEPGVDEERTQVWGESHCHGGNFGPGSGNNFPGEGVIDTEVDMDLVMATMGMVESLEAAALETALIMEEKEENMGLDTWILQTGVGQWRLS